MSREPLPDCRDAYTERVTFRMESGSFLLLALTLTLAIALRPR